MSRNATRASRRYGLHSAGTFLHGNAGSEKKRGSEFQSDPLLAFIPLSGTSPAAPAARHGTVAAFRAPHGPLRSAKSTSGVCPLRPIFVSRIPCPPPTGSPSTYSNRSAGASPQSRPTRVPHAVRGSRATPLRSSTGDIPARNTVRTRRSRATLRVCGRAYSSDYFNRYSSIAFLNASLGIAPCNICGLPLIGMKRIDGMLRMPNAAARSGSFSVLTL